MSLTSEDIRTWPTRDDLTVTSLKLLALILFFFIPVGILAILAIVIFIAAFTELFMGFVYFLFIIGVLYFAVMVLEAIMSLRGNDQPHYSQPDE